MSTPTNVFGVNIEELENEFHEDGFDPKYGSVLNDILVQHWDEFINPIIEFKSEKVYGIFKDLVHSKTITGTFYREVEDYEHFEHLQAGDQIDYRSALTTWDIGIPEYVDADILKITCQNVPGLEIYDLGKVILGECKLNVVSRDNNIIEVQI